MTTDHDEVFDASVARGYEVRDASVWMLVLFGIGLCAALVFALLGSGLLASYLKTHQPGASSRFCEHWSTESELPPKPRLEVDPHLDLLKSAAPRTRFFTATAGSIGTPGLSGSRSIAPWISWRNGLLDRNDHDQASFHPEHDARRPRVRWSSCIARAGAASDPPAAWRVSASTRN